MRLITEIFIHCSYTKKDQDIGVTEIREWHLARGWSDIGYHGVIDMDGVYTAGRDVRHAGAGVKGRNTHSLHFCLIGGMSEDNQPLFNFTFKQIEALRALVRYYKEMFPDALVLGHRDADKNKECPCFDVDQLLGDL